MWKKLKEWLIKKLGGYTESEYRNAMFPPIQYKPVNADRGNIVTLCSDMVIFFDHLVEPTSDYLVRIKERLCKELAMQIPAFVEYEVQDQPFEQRKKVRATMRVVRRD